jgi:hypothetical protein
MLHLRSALNDALRYRPFVNANGVGVLICLHTDCFWSRFSETGARKTPCSHSFTVNAMVRHAADAHKLTADRASWRNEFAYIKEKCGSELAVRPNLEIADVHEDIAPLRHFPSLFEVQEEALAFVRNTVCVTRPGFLCPSPQCQYVNLRKCRVSEHFNSVHSGDGEFNRIAWSSLLFK